MKRILKYIENTSSVRLFFPILFWGMFLKNLLLQSFLWGNNHYRPSFIEGGWCIVFGIFFGLLVEGLLLSPGLLFKKEKNKLRLTVIVSVVFTVLCVVDACYYRSSAEMPSVGLLLLVEGATEQGHLSLRSVIDTFSIYDILFYLDYLLILALKLIRHFLKKKRAQSPEGDLGEQPGELSEEKPRTDRKRTAFLKKIQEKWKEIFLLQEKSKGFGRRLLHSRLGHFSLCFSACVLALALLPLLHLMNFSEGISKAYRQIFNAPYQKDCVFYFTPIGYYAIDLVETLQSACSDHQIPDHLPEEKYPQIEEFYGYNAEQLADNEFAGMYEGKSVLLIQLESFEQCVLGQRINGKEITPNLNRLMEKSASSFCFTRIYDQVKSGNSSDCDLMINTSILPTTDIFFYYYSNRTLPSMPALLREKGYNTVCYNGSGPNCVWPYEKVYKSVFGYVTDEQDPSCNFHLLRSENEQDYLYNYVADSYTLNEVLEQLRRNDPQKKQFTHTVLCSSHMPYTFIFEDLPEEQLVLPQGTGEKRKADYVGGYLNCLHYVDAQLGQFLDTAEREGLLENTVVLIYGDHTGIHKYYPTEAEKLAKENEEYAFLDSEEYYTVPLIIYDPSGATAHRTVDTVGGQVDILPTLLYLLGVPKEEYSFAMGRVLLNTERNYTVLSNGAIVGKLDRNSPEYDIVYRMYDTADMIVYNNYFGFHTAPEIFRKKEEPSVLPVEN